MLAPDSGAVLVCEERASVVHVSWKDFGGRRFYFTRHSESSQIWVGTDAAVLLNYAVNDLAAKCDPDEITFVESGRAR